MKISLKGKISSGHAVQIPGSKSISNRLLLIKSIANPDCLFTGISDSRDTELLGNSIQNPLPVCDLEDGATPARFMIALAAAKHIPATITGTAGLKKRSMQPLADALSQLGAELLFPENSGFLPVTIKTGIQHFTEVDIDTSQSSQHASALMLVAPLFPGDKTIHLKGNQQAGFSYIQLTSDCMKMAGVHAEIFKNKIVVSAGTYNLPDTLRIEPDWSSAAWPYMFAAAVPGFRLQLPGFEKNSMQADKKVADLFAQLGVKTTFNDSGILISNNENISNVARQFDLKSHIDLAPALISTCAFLKIPAFFYGLENLKYKESDRIQALTENLAQLGIQLEKSGNGYLLNYAEKMTPPGMPVKIHTFNDHRIAMAMSLFAIRYEMEPDNAECVKKSFPGYWDMLRSFNFVVA